MSYIAYGRRWWWRRRRWWWRRHHSGQRSCSNGHLLYFVSICMPLIADSRPTNEERGIGIGGGGGGCRLVQHTEISINDTTYRCHHSRERRLRRVPFTIGLQEEVMAERTVVVGFAEIIVVSVFTILHHSVGMDDGTRINLRLFLRFRVIVASFNSLCAWMRNIVVAR